MTLEHANARWIALDGAANARVVVPGVLLRSDNLQSLTTRDVAVLVEDQALEVVLDLRTDVEVELEGPGPITLEPRVRISTASEEHGSRCRVGQPMAASRPEPVAG